MREAADVEAVEPLTLKGKPEPVPAFRLVTVTAGTAVARRFATPFVGRDHELEQLRAISERVAAETPLIGLPGLVVPGVEARAAGAPAAVESYHVVRCRNQYCSWTV